VSVLSHVTFNHGVTAKGWSAGDIADEEEIFTKRRVEIKSPLIVHPFSKF
jgi:hypothetical protein